jgi:hypothetical protein
MNPRRRPGQPQRRWTRACLTAVFAATFLASVLSALPASASGIFVRSANPAGEADLVTEGANHTLQYYWATPGGTWNHAQVAGAGTTFSAPSIFVRSDGEADIVAEGVNHTLQYYFATPGNPFDHAQVAGAGTTYSAPSIFVRTTDPAGEADIVAQGVNHTLQYYFATPGNPFGHVQVAGAGTTYDG